MPPRRRCQTAAQPFITMRDIAIRLPDRVMFADSSWTIQADEQWAVVGPNGSGKSTLVRALWGGVPVVRGEVRYDFAGDSGAGWPEGFLPENEIVHVSFEDQREMVRRQSGYYQSRWHSFEGEDAPTVAAVLVDQRVQPWSAGPGGAARSGGAADAARKQADDRLRPRLARLMGIANLLNRKTVHLSNGELHKVLIARVLMQRPAMLILDDPFGGLDNASRAGLRRVIGELAAGPMRMVLIASQAEEVPPTITHILMVKGGRIVARGRRAEVLPTRSKARARPAPRPSAKAGAAASAGTGEVLVRIADASVRYDDVEVLHGVSWTIRQGENWALLGPNGSGKTTLLSLILGDNPQAYASDVEVLHRRRGAGESVWDVKHGIGYVAPEMQMHYEPDTPALAVVCSGFFDSVSLYRRPTPAQRQAAMAWLRRMGLARLAGRDFGDLSAGQQRVLLMARAMVKAPRLLVLDEPCQGLDAANRDRIVRLVDRMAAGGATGVVYVTHHVQEIPSCVTRVLKLRAGRVVARTRWRM